MKYVLLPMFRFIIVIAYYLLGLLSTILIYTIFGYILRDIIWNFNFKYKLLDDIYFEKDNKKVVKIDDILYVLEKQEISKTIAYI